MLAHSRVLSDRTCRQDRRPENNLSRSETPSSLSSRAPARWAERMGRAVNCPGRSQILFGVAIALRRSAGRRHEYSQSSESSRRRWPAVDIGLLVRNARLRRFDCCLFLQDRAFRQPAVFVRMSRCSHYPPRSPAKSVMACAVNQLAPASPLCARPGVANRGDPSGLRPSGP